MKFYPSRHLLLNTKFLWITANEIMGSINEKKMQERQKMRKLIIAKTEKTKKLYIYFFIAFFIRMSVVIMMKPIIKYSR